MKKNWLKPNLVNLNKSRIQSGTICASTAGEGAGPYNGFNGYSSTILYLNTPNGTTCLEPGASFYLDSACTFGGYIGSGSVCS